MKEIFFTIRYYILSLVLFSLLSTSIKAAHANKEAVYPPKINARAFILMDYHSGTILAEDNADQHLNPASLTKIMSSYIIGQSIKSGQIHPDDIVKIGEEAWASSNHVLRGSSLMFLEPGEYVSVLDLNKGMVIQSGNDATIALVNYVAGSQDNFVTIMNQYAQKLGMKNTNFINVHGLDIEGQYSTARDMAILSKALIHDVPEEYALHKEKEFTYKNIKQFNRNRLLWSKHLNIDGVKTGYTSGAGHNLVSSATSNGMRLISVIFGAPTDMIRFRDSEKLLLWGFRYYETITPISKSYPFIRQRVWFGEKREIDLGIVQDIAITLPKEQSNKIKTSCMLSSTPLKAPLTKNQIVGTIGISLDDHLIKSIPLVVMADVKKGSFFSCILDWMLLKIHRLFIFQFI